MQRKDIAKGLYLDCRRIMRLNEIKVRVRKEPIYDGMIDWQSRKRDIKKQCEIDRLSKCTWNKGITKPFVVKKDIKDSKVY